MAKGEIILKGYYFDSKKNDFGLRHWGSRCVEFKEFEYTNCTVQ